MEFVHENGRRLHLVALTMRDWFDGYMEGLPGYDFVLTNAKDWARSVAGRYVPVHVEAPLAEETAVSAGAARAEKVRLFPVKELPWQGVAIVSSTIAGPFGDGDQKRMAVLFFIDEPGEYTVRELAIAACARAPFDDVAVTWTD